MMDKSFNREKLIYGMSSQLTSLQKNSFAQDEKVMRNLISLVRKYEDTLTNKEQRFITNLRMEEQQFLCTFLCKEIKEHIH